jgi:hypothetical protein
LVKRLTRGLSVTNGKHRLIERFLAENTAAALKDTPVVLIIGPRQSGKTTLARQLITGKRDHLRTVPVAAYQSPAFHHPLGVPPPVGRRPQIHRRPVFLGSVVPAADAPATGDWMAVEAARVVEAAKEAADAVLVPLLAADQGGEAAVEVGAAAADDASNSCGGHTRVDPCNSVPNNHRR